MKHAIKHAVQMGLAFFVIGVALALAAEPVAQAIGFTGAALKHIAAANAMPVWTGTFFGMFGALSTVVPPAFGKLLRVEEASPTIKNEITHNIEVNLKKDITGVPLYRTDHAAQIDSLRSHTPQETVRFH